MDAVTEIPSFPSSRGIVLADKPLLDSSFAQLQPSVSELTFTNLYLFRAAHAYRLSLVGDALVVLGSGYDGRPYALPPLVGDVAGALRRLRDVGMSLYGADEPFVAHYLREREWRVEEDRDSFDYLYLRQELANLPGNRFHKKKNRINYFMTRHPCAVEPFEARHLAGCADLLAAWERVRSQAESRSLSLEVGATAEALSLAAVLGLEGVVVVVAGEVRAFALGERLNRETAVCHFEKADPFMEGLPQLVNREFARRCFTDCTYLNREQDLGEAGLREAKLSYHPVTLVKKFRAWPAMVP